MEWSRVQVMRSHARHGPRKGGTMNDYPSLLPAAGRLLIAAISPIWGRMKVPLPTSLRPPHLRRNCPTC
jgi:hypothetical protein